MEINLLVQDIEKGELLTPCMDVYQAKIQYYGSLDKLKLRIVVRVNLQNKDLRRTIYSVQNDSKAEV